MQIARIGEIGPMQRLFDEKKFTANYQDEEGITPLHVSANQLFLLNLLAITLGHVLMASSGTTVGRDQ